MNVAQRRPHPASRRGQPARGLSSLTLTSVALVLFSFAMTEQATPGPPPQPDSGQAFQPGQTPSTPAGPTLPSATPTRLKIPTIGVNAPLTGLSLENGGRLAAPPEDERNLVGWYEDGITPGSRGTAIAAGHVDIPSGPAVFYNLGTLNKGMYIDIDRADHRTARFIIDAIEVYPTDTFPSTKVYADRHRAELRLITCGGGYDTTHHRYRGNVVVYAHLTTQPTALPH
ncbi:class F sortase [Streptomyces boninensis]|uniref:class F sortase n=1 Tax=Streptomyces boninensis TaxID=2039455 RepID=UPI003B215448